METWEEIRATLLREAELSDAQLELVRRAGARRRHEERVLAAERELAEAAAQIRADAPIGLALASVGIDRALGFIGLPGSSSGSGPPGWYRAHPHVGCRIAAMRRAIMPYICHGRELLAAHGAVLRDGELRFADMAVLPLAAHRELAYHIGAYAAEMAARRLDRWATAKPLGGTAPMPAPPDAELCAWLASPRPWAGA